MKQRLAALMAMVAASLVTAPSASFAAPVGTAPVDECDTLTADELDPKAVAKGVSSEELQAERAVAACSAAVQRYPLVARFHAQLARALWRKDDLDKALKSYQQAADLGSAVGFDGLAEFYMWGRAVGADRDKAFAFWVEAAERGYPPAEVKLGWMARDGYARTTEQKTTAATWARHALASRIGWVGIEARRLLCWMAQTGTGMEPDTREAFRNCKEAAESGNADAQNELAWSYRRGIGTPQNIAEAVRWYGRSAAQGHQWSREALGNLTARELTLGAQMLLWERGYDPGAIDGIVRPLTILAVEKFQAQQNVPADPRISPELVISLAMDAKPR